MLQMCDSNGRWTAVCGYGWRCSTSKVACKQLGYTGNSKYTQSLIYIAILQMFNIKLVLGHGLFSDLDHILLVVVAAIVI